MTSLPGPPLPPRVHSQVSLRSAAETNNMKLRRSTSESKVDKDRKNEARAIKSRSVHFDGSHHRDEGNGDMTFKQISIIGHDKAADGTNKPKPLETNLDEAINDLPPPPPDGKRKVIVAQRPNSFIVPQRYVSKIFYYEPEIHRVGD